MAGDVAVVVGVGEGIGGALVERFARDGYRVAAIARSEARAKAAAARGGEGARAYACDATDEAQVRATFAAVRAELGEPSALLYNAGSGRWGTFDQVAPADFEHTFRVNVLGLFLAAREVVPAMRARGRGVVGVTGATASWRGKPMTTAFAAGKAAQRSLAQSMARELGPAGVHVFYVVVDGVVDLPVTRERARDLADEAFLKPADVAETYALLARQPRSAWTFELDVRPAVERW
ncbi:MAG TPA: SDR family NAD(P)-dependent oxidoreductase [Polyangiaceae bacterium]|nr:SDR family NAD(P)-dependent oxidoreductase [Polyangiaceae bacterium]